MKMRLPIIMAKFAVKQLANADYSIATKITHDVATFVPWALDNNLGNLADFSLFLLQRFDELGNAWILLTLWIVAQAH